MQQSQDISPITCSQKFPSVEFKIAASPHAFSILSSSLYSDKIQSVVREISCNCVDAHCFVGKGDLPFDIHIPNTFEPYFSARDYGPGLSEEEVYTLYTTYFSSGSEKLRSNAYIGGFGLGSKSFFAYTDTCNITSFQNKRRSEYTLVVEDGFPKVLKISSDKHTDEPDGLCVQFSVKTSDIQSFRYAAKSVFQYMYPHPNVLGWSAYKHDPVVYTLRSSSWGLHGSYDTRVIMGGIAYPCPTIHLGMKGVDIFLPIGSCDITPSREALSYTSKTTSTLDNIRRDILKNAKELAQVEIDKCHTRWEASLLLQKYNTYWNSIAGTFLSCSWNGMVLPSQDISLNPKTLTVKSISLSYRGKKACRVTDTNTIRVSAYSRFYKDDVNIGMLPRCSKFLRENRDSVNTIYLCDFKDRDAEKDFCDQVGISTTDIELVSSMPKEVRIISKRSSTGMAGQTLFKYDGVKRYTRCQSRSWVLCQDIKDIKELKYYVPMTAYKINDNGVHRHPEILAGYLQIFKSLDFDFDEPIYGLRTTYSKKKRQSCINFIEYAKAKILEKYNQQNITKVLQKYYELHNTDNIEVWVHLSNLWGSRIQEIKTDNAVYTLINDIQTYYMPYKDRIDILSKIPVLLGIPDQPKYHTKKNRDINLPILSEYPMLSFVLDSGIYDLDKKKAINVLNYILGT